jgi:hypothetical protein
LWPHASRYPDVLELLFEIGTPQLKLSYDLFAQSHQLLHAHAREISVGHLCLPRIAFGLA